MNQFLRNLTPGQQVGLLFVILFGMLMIATVTLLVVSLRERESARGQARAVAVGSLTGLLSTSWLIAIVFWVGWASGERVATALFAVVSFFTLREFVTLSPTRRGDHRSLILAFFVVLPVQFWLVASEHFDLFSVFIPVYVFLLIPVVSALANDPQRFRAQRQAAVGHYGVRVRHEPCARAAVAGLSALGRAQERFFGVLFGFCGANQHGGAAFGARLGQAPRARATCQQQL